MSSSKTWLPTVLMMFIVIATVYAYENLVSEGEILFENDFHRDEIKELSQREQGMYSKRDELNQPMSKNTDVVSLEKRQFGPFCPYYGSNTELCCGNTVYRGSFPYNAVCCGNSYMDSNTALCCNNVIHIVNDGINQLSCCGANIYNFTSQICCNNVTNPQSGNSICCGHTIYDPIRQICCNGNVSPINGQILSCCGKISYKLNKFQCTNSGLRAKPQNATVTQICGGQTINYMNQMCCEGIPKTRNNSMTLCCGTTTFDSSKQMCCNGTVYTNPKPGSSCCKKKLYNSNTQVCCNGNVITRPENSVGEFSYCYPQPEFGGDGIGGGYSPYFDCCGTQLITNFTTQICCENKLHYRNVNDYSQSCCGSNLYTSNNQTCCDGRVINRPNVSCCGRIPYNLNNNICCNHLVYRHNRVPANKCCTRTI